MCPQSRIHLLSTDIFCQVTSMQKKKKQQKPQPKEHLKFTFILSSLELQDRHE